MAYGARLESVLGATPREFESRILRRASENRSVLTGPASAELVHDSGPVALLRDRASCVPGGRGRPAVRRAVFDRSGCHASTDEAHRHPAAPAPVAHLTHGLASQATGAITVAVKAKRPFPDKHSDYLGNRRR